MLIISIIDNYLSLAREVFPDVADTLHSVGEKPGHRETMPATHMFENM